MEDIDKNIGEILKVFDNAMNDKEKFYHILEQIEKHVVKLRKLKEKEDRPGHFNTEVADMLLLGKALFELENINDETLSSASKCFLEKIKEIYG